MTDTSIINLYFDRSEQAIEESQSTYGGYCYRVANGILNDPLDSEESVNDTYLAAWNSIPPQKPAFFISEKVVSSIRFSPRHLCSC